MNIEIIILRSAKKNQTGQCSGGRGTLGGVAMGGLPEEVTLNPQEGEELITCRSGEENGWSTGLRREEEDMSLERMRSSKILLAPWRRVDFVHCMVDIHCIGLHSYTTAGDCVIVLEGVQGLQDRESVRGSHLRDREGVNIFMRSHGRADTLIM